MRRFSVWQVIFILTAVFGICGRCLSFAAEDKPALTLKAELDKRVISIGEKFKYNIIVKSPDKFEIEFPAFGTTLGNFQIKDSGTKTASFFGRKTTRLWLLLDTFETGKTSIPKAVIKYRQGRDKQWKEAETREEPIEVKSIMEKAGQGENARIRDIKGPLAQPRRYRLLILLTILFLAAALPALYFILRKKKKRMEALLPKRPAHEIALSQMEWLKIKNLPGSGKFKQFYSEISMIIRHYLENRFALRAPEMTTEEFLFYARDYAQLDSAHKALLKDFLCVCDLVKFAKHLPSIADAEALFEAAKNFIIQTKEEERKK